MSALANGFQPAVRSVSRPTDPNAAPMREASDLVRGLSYGEVRIVVTGGKITAVEATEKRVYNTRQKD